MQLHDLVSLLASLPATFRSIVAYRETNESESSDVPNLLQPLAAAVCKEFLTVDENSIRKSLY